MNRFARKVDTTQSDIVDALERIGCEVTDTSGAGWGIPDLIVTRAGVNYLLECKSMRGKLTPAQIKFHFKHVVHIVRTPEEAIEAVGLIGYVG